MMVGASAAASDSAESAYAMPSCSLHPQLTPAVLVAVVGLACQQEFNPCPPLPAPVSRPSLAPRHLPGGGPGVV
jgi:hypothetical protein